MKRFVQILVAAIWLVGAVVGGFDVHPSAPISEEPSMRLVIDTDHARLGVDRSRVVLAVETPWQSRWCVAAPLPEILTPNRSTKTSSRSETAAPSSIFPSIIRSFAPLP
jgi:hypothetical protein